MDNIDNMSLNGLNLDSSDPLPLATSFRPGLQINAALFTAVKKDDIQTVDSLSKNGSINDLNECTARYLTSIALQNGSTRIFKLLLQHGAKIDCIDFIGRTHLIKYIDWISSQLLNDGVKEMVNFLIEEGVNVKSVTKAGETALDWAILSDLPVDVIAMIEKAAGRYDEKGMPDVYRAIKKRNDPLLHYYAVRDSSMIDLKDYKSLTPLQFAVLCNNKDAFYMLAEFGANVNVQNDMGKTALHMALGMNCEEMAIAIQQCNPISDIRDDDGHTPIQCFYNMCIPDKSLKDTVNEWTCEDDEFSGVWPPDDYMIDEEFIIMLNKTLHANLDKISATLHPRSQNWNRAYVTYKDLLQILKATQESEFYNNLTFYDLLTKSDHQLDRILRRNDFSDDIKQLITADTFKHYTFLFVQRLKDIEHYHEHKTTARQVMMEVCGNQLPNEAICVIVDNLQAAGIRSLLRATIYYRKTAPF